MVKSKKSIKTIDDIKEEESKEIFNEMFSVVKRIFDNIMQEEPFLQGEDLLEDIEVAGSRRVLDLCNLTFGEIK